MNEIVSNSILDVDEKLYKTFEYLREKHNKIILNIQKMISCSSNFINEKSNFDKNTYGEFTKDEIKGKNNMRKNNNILIEKNWIENLSNDIDKLNNEYSPGIINLTNNLHQPNEIKFKTNTTIKQKEVKNLSKKNKSLNTPIVNNKEIENKQLNNFRENNPELYLEIENIKNSLNEAHFLIKNLASKCEMLQEENSMLKEQVAQLNEENSRRHRILMGESNKNEINYNLNNYNGDKSSLISQSNLSQFKISVQRKNSTDNLNEESKKNRFYLGNK